MSPRATTPGPTPWRVLWVPAASGAAAALALASGIVATGPAPSSVVIVATPERAAEMFVEAYQRRDWDAASHLASGALARSLQSRARSGPLQRVRAVPGRQLEIEESFTLESDRLRFAGKLVSERTPDARGWPVSITVGRYGDRYLAESLTWPKGVPPDEPQ